MLILYFIYGNDCLCRRVLEGSQIGLYFAPCRDMKWLRVLRNLLIIDFITSIDNGKNDRSRLRDWILFSELIILPIDARGNVHKSRRIRLSS